MQKYFFTQRRFRSQGLVAVIAVLAAWSIPLLTGCSGAGPAPFKLPPPTPETVLITEQPVSQTIPAGQAAIFTVQVAGTAPFTYQWSKNGTQIAGATSAAYTTPPIDFSDSGAQYQVTVTNAVSSETSKTATITVGARSPEANDLRFQLVDSPALDNPNSADGISSNIVGGSSAYYDNAIGTPLDIGYGVCYPGIPYGCAWPYAASGLPSGMNGLDIHYYSGAYIQFSSDLQSLMAPNTVITCLDLQPANSTYAVAWMETNETTGFDGHLQVISPSALQSTAEQEGLQSRVITAASFDAQGQINLLSYGWQQDTTTQYETEAMVVTPDNVISTVTSMANDGYILTAFGGDITNGFILVGTRVQGDSLPRPIIAITSSTPAANGATFGYAVVARFGALLPTGGETAIVEK
jgi:hypothetical protein